MNVQKIAAKVQANHILQTIIKQASAHYSAVVEYLNNLTGRKWKPMNRYTSEDNGTTLNIHFVPVRSKGVDDEQYGYSVHYNAGLDLYDIECYHYKDGKVKKGRKLEGVDFEIFSNGGHIFNSLHE